MTDKNKFEYHFGIVILYATGYDGVISDEELDNMTTILSGLLRGMGNEDTALDYLTKLIDETKVMSPAELFEHTTKSVLFIKDNLEPENLEKIYETIRLIMGNRDLSPEETKFMEALKDMWEI